MRIGPFGKELPKRWTRLRVQTRRIGNSPRFQIFEIRLHIHPSRKRPFWDYSANSSQVIKRTPYINPRTQFGNHNPKWPLIHEFRECCPAPRSTPSRGSGECRREGMSFQLSGSFWWMKKEFSPVDKNECSMYNACVKACDQCAHSAFIIIGNEPVPFSRKQAQWCCFAQKKTT